MNPRDLPEVTAAPPAGHRSAPTNRDPRCVLRPAPSQALLRPAVRRAAVHHRRQTISSRHGSPSTRSGEPT